MYQIVRERSYESDLALITQDNPAKMDLIDSGIDFMLSRAPQRFHPLGNDYYLWATDDLFHEVLPSMLIAYRFDAAAGVVYLQRLILASEVRDT